MNKKLDLSLSLFRRPVCYQRAAAGAKAGTGAGNPGGGAEPFRNHPFQVQQDKEVDRLCRSMKEYGVLSPLVARPAAGGYEIVYTVSTYCYNEFREKRG